MARKKSSSSVLIETVKHKDKRTNIPTEELRDFVAEDEKKPKKVLYPRDPSLDPQLVWKGKDEQDSQPLEVPAVPIYIQEKIHPHALIENLRNTAKEGEEEPEFKLFADFNGIKFEDLIEFYQHKDGVNWANRMILGDSLMVMTSLAEKEGLKGKVQMIYVDPPYGIKFGSNWQVSTRKRDVKDRAEDATRQPEQVRAFRDTWKLGIHSYLAYLRDRLAVARDLLTESGSVFVQIGQENVHLVRNLLDEVFGSDNFIAIIAFVTTTSQTSDFVPCVTDFLLWYGKDKTVTKFREVYVAKDIEEAKQSSYARFEVGETLHDAEPVGQRWKLLVFDNLTSRSGGESTTQPFKFNGKAFTPKSGGWKTSGEGLKRLGFAERLHAKGESLFYKRYFLDFPFVGLSNTWLDTQPGGFGKEAKVYVVQTHPKVIERCVLMTTDPGDLVLDPTCGGGTTAYVAEQWGRRWITIDTSRVALALARTRLMTAKFPYYLLADSAEGTRKESELQGKVLPETKTNHDIKKGFVYGRVPHITLGSIANNPDIKENMSREEIDAAIAKHVDTELLYDKPYEDSKRVRVTGPFTVESLSPHRVLSTDEERPTAEGNGQQETAAGQFEPMIVENLKKAGVQNTKKDERLKFDRLETFAGTWIHAAGDYTDSEGKSRRVAVSIGPEHGTVSPEQVKEAAKEAVQGIGYDLLIVCGFAFDPHVSEEVKRYGKLTVLTAKMNPDLSMGDELLKKTGAGNLFMVFGEPDVEIKKHKDGKIVAVIKGVDVYDPTTGEIRSSSTDDIACWFIDTDYNGESFFVRHAYFTGAEEPYDKLKRALRAEIDEAAWSTLYSTTSRPFDPPKKGKVAIKVINHYGDEVLKVFEVK